MKKLLLALVACLVIPVYAQPTPQSPADAQKEYRAAQRERYDLRDQNPHQPQWDQRERHRQWREHQRYCREWRARVERHPRLILPRECWRR
jgi:hypothetical protein